MSRDNTGELEKYVGSSVREAPRKGRSREHGHGKGVSASAASPEGSEAGGGTASVKKVKSARRKPDEGFAGAEVDYAYEAL